MSTSAHARRLDPPWNRHCQLRCRTAVESSPADAAPAASSLALGKCGVFFNHVARLLHACRGADERCVFSLSGRVLHRVAFCSGRWMTAGADRRTSDKLSTPLVV